MILASMRRIAIGVAGHQRAQLYSFGRGGQRAQRGVGLQHRLVGSAQHRQLVEVVHHEDRVETGRFGLLGLGDDGGEELLHPGAVGEIGNLQTESNSHVFYRSDRLRKRNPKEIAL